VAATFDTTVRMVPVRRAGHQPLRVTAPAAGAVRAPPVRKHSYDGNLKGARPRGEARVEPSGQHAQGSRGEAKDPDAELQLPQ
jgi:hypothetical protein